MSEAFIVAGELTLSPEEYEAWLAEPAPRPDAIDDWDRMYAGWYWKTRKAALDWESDGTIEDVLRDIGQLGRDHPYIVCLKYSEEEGKFRFYVMSMMGNDDRLTEQLFALTRAAAEHKHAETMDTVVYWPEMSGELVYGSILSVALIGPGTSEFGDAADLAAAGLPQKELEKRFAPLTKWFQRYFDEAFKKDSSAPRPAAWARPAFIDERFITAE